MKKPSIFNISITLMILHEGYLVDTSSLPQVYNLSLPLTTHPPLDYGEGLGVGRSIAGKSVHTRKEICQKQEWARRDSNTRSSPCEGDVIAN